MLTKEEFVQFIVEGPKTSASKNDKSTGETALPEGFDEFGFGDQEATAPATETTSFARNLMEASGFGPAQYLERSEVILGDDPAAKYLSESVYYWSQSNDRPYQTLLFELDIKGSDLLKTPLFRSLKSQQILEDALSRLVQMSLKGFERGGERRTASVKQGRQAETLCIVSCVDDREEAKKQVNLVCFGTVSADQNSLESFHIREESKYWEPQIRDDHLEKLYKRHFSKLTSDKWQDAFISGEERKLARKLLDICIEKKANEKQIQESSVELLEEIAKSFGLRRKGGKEGRRLTAFDLPPDHDIGMDPDNIEKHSGTNPFSGITLRDEKSRLLGYIIYCLDEKKDAIELRNYLLANNRFHNVLIIYPDGDHAELELWQGKVPLAGKLTKQGANYQGEGEIVNLLSRFFVVSKAKVKSPTELAQELAFRARYLRKLAIKELEEEEDEGLLRNLYNAFKESLVHDQTEEEFADAFAQTLTYGLLTARWMGSENLSQTGERFTRQNALKYLPTTSNFLGDLFETALSLKLNERRGRLLWLVDDIANLLDRIDVNYVFGAGDKDSDQVTDPVIHFYEPFLAQYDQKLKNQRGVFFTPRPVVSFIVRSVHELLQREFGLEDGLASIDTWGDMQQRFMDLDLPEGVKITDPFVCIIDPANGTGTFLYECIELIETTMKEKWRNELKTTGWSGTEITKRWNEYVQTYLIPRLFGFEIIMASYSIAHLKLIFKLKNTGYEFSREDKLHVYLTNTLEPPSGIQEELSETFPSLAREATEVNIIKKEKTFTVMIGNPPYSGTSSNDGNWINELLRSNLADGSNSYMTVDNRNLGEKQIRWLLDDYVKFMRYYQWHISKAKIGIVGVITNHGFIEGPIFRGMRQSLCNSFTKVEIVDLHGNSKRQERASDGSEDKNVFEITQGVAISLLTSMTLETEKSTSVNFYDLLGNIDYKYNWLANNSISNVNFKKTTPISPYYSYKSMDTRLEEEYLSWWKISEIFNNYNVGIVTARDKFCIAFDRDNLWERINEFIALPPNQAREHFNIGKDSNDWGVERAQDDIRETGPDKKRILKILYRPFDIRYTYYTGNNKGFHARPCPAFARNMIDCANIGLVTARSIEISKGWEHILCTNIMSMNHTVSIKETNYLFPLYILPRNDSLKLFEDKETRKINFTERFVNELIAPLGKAFNKTIPPRDMLSYIYAILHSKGYRSRFASLLKRDYASIPITKNMDLFHSISEIGKSIIDVHLMDSPLLLNGFSASSTMGDSPIEKIFYSDGDIWVDKEKAHGFRQVPEKVWYFSVGGYQVCQKWLKDRKGRLLSQDDIEHYQKIIVAIGETIRLQAEIDKVINKHGGWPGAFVTEKGGAS